MIWNADLMLEAGYISRIHPVLDWLLYGVDLIEIVTIINVGMILYSLLKKRYKAKNQFILPSCITIWDEPSTSTI